MKAPDWDEEVVNEQRAHLGAAAARAAFDLLVTDASDLPGYFCHAEWKGYFRHFKYIDATSNQWPFAFIVNRQDLTFYIRKAGQERVPGGLNALKNQFSTVSAPRPGEWVIHIASRDDARRLVQLLFNRGLPVTLPRPKYWWVNHKQTYRQEIDGEYLWSPKKNQNGATNESYNNMTHVRPGDVIFSFANGQVGAIGVALGRAHEGSKPAEFGAAGEQWGTDPGWRLPVRFAEIANPLRPQEHAAELAAVLPNKYSPIRANGHGNQGVYLAAIPEEMAVVLQRLLAGQVAEVERQIGVSQDADLADEVVEDVIQQRTDIGPREKVGLVKSRRGQGVYRDNLELIEKACRVTRVADKALLRASHIKPWRFSDDREKLDGFNGLLLSPHVDHLFDKGYISFADDGELLVSKDLDTAVLKAWGLLLPLSVGPFRAEQCVYLDYHRRELLRK